MAVAVQCVLLSVFLLSSVQTGAGQCDGECTCKVPILNIQGFCMHIVQGICAAVFEVLSPVLNEMKDELNSLKEMLSNLNGTVEEHKSQTSSEIDSLGTLLQSHIDGLPTTDETGNAVLLKLIPYLNNMEEDLNERIDESASSLAADFHNGLSSLNGSVTDIRVKVCDLNETVGDLEETVKQHKSQTTSTLADLQSTIDNPPTDDNEVVQTIVQYMTNLEDDLREKIDESANSLANGLQASLSSLNGSVTDIRVKVCDLNETVINLEETMEEYKSEISSTLANLQSSINNPPTDEIGNAVLLKILPHLNNTEKDLCDKIDESVNSLSGGLSSLSGSVTDLRVTVGDLSDSVSNQDEALTDLNDTVSNLEETMEKQTVALADLYERMDDSMNNLTGYLRSELSIINGSITDLSNKVCNVSDAVSNMNETVSNLEETVEEHERQTKSVLADIQERVDESAENLAEDLHNLNDLYRNMSDTVSDLEKAVSNLDETASHMNETVTELNETVEKHKNQTTTEIAELHTLLQSPTNNPPTDVLGNAVVLKLLPYLNNMEDELNDRIDESANSLAADFHNGLSGLNGSVTDMRVKVCDLNETVGDLEETVEEHKSQTSSELADLQSSIDNPPTGVIANAVLLRLLPYLKNMEYELNDRIDESANEIIDSQLEEYRSHTNTTLDRLQDHIETTMEKLIFELCIFKIERIYNLLQVHVNGYTCGGEGGWRRVVYLDMTDPTTSCPSGWQNNGYSKRSCGRVSSGLLTCDSAFFPVTGGNYTRVCGKIIGYQNGITDAFEAYDNGRVTTIDGAYVSGVSLTHGSPREHIWTFAAGYRENNPTLNMVCPCDATISIAIPPFVGGDYFCESGVHSGLASGFHPDDPLWDGQGCTSTSTCCSFNNPPYFTKQLSSPTTDDIEARICQWDNIDDSPIEFMELYVK